MLWHIDGTFQFGRQFSIKQTVNHCLGMLPKGCFSTLNELFEKIRQFHCIRVEYQFMPFVFGGDLRLRFDIFPPLVYLPGFVYWLNLCYGRSVAHFCVAGNENH